jgi:Na+/proline symporter
MLALMVLNHFGGPVGLTQAIHAAHPAEANDILSAFPVPGHRVFGPLVVLAWLIVPTIGVGGGVSTDGQRIFSCRSLKEAAKVGIWGEIALFAYAVSSDPAALGAIVGPSHLYHTPIRREREAVYGILLHDYLPTGLLGIALAALLSAVMSTIDSHLNYGSQTLLNDVYRPIFGEPSPGRALWVGRSFMIVILLSAIAVVFFSKSLMGIAVTLSGLFGSSAAFGWGLWWWWRVNRASWFSAIIGGPIIYLALGAGLGHWDWWAAQCAASETSAQSMGMLQAVISMTIGTIVWVATTLATKPEDMTILKRFYKTARPMGLWGPVKEAIVRDEGPEALPPQHRFMILGGMGTALLGFLWVALAILGISVLYVGRYGDAAAMAAGAVILALCFKRAFNWHVNRML